MLFLAVENTGSVSQIHNPPKNLTVFLIYMYYYTDVKAVTDFGVKW